MTVQPFPDNDDTKQTSEARSPQRAFAVWFTGLPCSGKTTLANALNERLSGQRIRSVVLDGDELRKGLNADLGYTPDDRKENIRRAAEATKLLLKAGIVTICSFITPTRPLRSLARQIIGESDFVEVFVKCPVDVCEQRDVKGMYRKARNGEIQNFTGVSATFEEPADANVVIDTSVLTVDQCVEALMTAIAARLK